MSFSERTVMVIGKEKYDAITDKKIVLAGVGGVGGAVLESLARFGIKNITIIDFDKVDETNLNRQLISTVRNIGRNKVDVARERVLSINPECNITTYNMFINAGNIGFIKDINPDYVIDAIDSVKSKLDLIEFCHRENIPVVSSMGTGNRFSCTGFVIGRVEDTAGNGCGLSRVMRHELKKRNIENHMSLYNTNPPESSATNDSHGRHSPGSTMFAPNVAGIMLAQYVCEQLGK